MSYETLLCEAHGPVTLLRLNRPQALNALNTQTLADLIAAFANKEMVNAAFETGLAQGILFERRLFNGLCATADKQEGMSAFVEKRKGTWRAE
jgi:enoyl-CoA hydratase